MEQIVDLLIAIYGETAARETAERIEALIEDYREGDSAEIAQHFDQSDAVLITYGDMVRSADEPPLQTLRRFLEAHVAGVLTGVHLLPFYPYSSDDGFSVIDYLQVDPALGDWADVEAFDDSFRLMFDAVINHISQHSAWFQAFKRGEAPYTDYFKQVDPQTDLSAVFRPRALPLLTPVTTASGETHVWTTFSDDQIDLNYESADLLLDVLRVLLEYVRHGADMLRLDAIGFMWKQPGTRSIHLPQTHAIIQLMRLVLDAVRPTVALVTETNVPHHENISYFGDGTNEAQMVYNFSLPPLLLHTFHTGDARVLAAWAAERLPQPSDKTTFFNFCASHDGVGLTPARGLLDETEIDAIATRVAALGGFVSYKTNSDGSQSAYELNINYLDALGVPDTEESEALMAQRFLSSQAIMLALRGVPGIYFHSLFGSRGWRAGVAQTGRNRTINRQRLERKQLEQELATGLRQRVFGGFCAMLRVRSAEKAFHPHGEQQIIPTDAALFAVERSFEGSRVLCLHNVAAEAQVFKGSADGEVLFALGQPVIGDDCIELPPYAVVWIQR